jgi:flagellar basal-body rod modification protein FlgD
MTISNIDQLLSSISMEAQTSATMAASTSNQTDFMAILLAQLKNQNPLEPMSSNDMMTQMAQLNSLQELKSIQASMDQLAAANSASFAASLVGKYVKATLNDGTKIEGTVDSTSFKNGVYLLNIGDKQFSLSTITDISQTPPPPDKTTKALDEAYELPRHLPNAKRLTYV